MVSRELLVQAFVGSEGWVVGETKKGNPPLVAKVLHLARLVHWSQETKHSHLPGPATQKHLARCEVASIVGLVPRSRCVHASLHRTEPQQKVPAWTFEAYPSFPGFAGVSHATAATAPPRFRTESEAGVLCQKALTLLAAPSRSHRSSPQAALQAAA